MISILYKTQIQSEIIWLKIFLSTSLNTCLLMKGIISYNFFASRIYHMLLECYWSCIILFICPCVDLFLHICFSCAFAFFTLPPQGDDSSVSAQSEILSVDLRTLCHAWVICVDIGTNSRRASERERLVSVHVNCGSKYYIYCILYMAIVVTQQNCIFFLFHLKQVFVCELCSVWVGWLWLINFPNVL